MKILIECIDEEGLLLVTKEVKGSGMLKLQAMEGWPGWFTWSDPAKAEGLTLWKTPENATTFTITVDRG